MKINKVMTILTIFTAIIWIHTLIAGLYGMNVPLPFERNNLTFWYIILLIFTITIILLFVFRRKRRF
jgi:magnesium transporter